MMHAEGLTFRELEKQYNNSNDSNDNSYSNADNSCEQNKGTILSA